jgi:biotin operon repressor
VLRAHQPDLRRSLAAKRAALQTAVSTLREAGYTLVTLAEAANELQSVPPAPCG